MSLSAGATSNKIVMTSLIIVIIAVSILAGIEYQQGNSLRENVHQLEAKNSELLTSISILNKTLSSVSATFPTENTTISRPATGNGSGANEPLNLNYSSQSITAVAVRAVPTSDGFFQSVTYEGTTMDITVDIRDSGKGLVLVDTGIPTGVDFQTAAKTAVKVAQSVTKADLSKKDVIFSISPSNANNTTNELEAVDGPSAGAAMTTLLISELQNKKMNPDVVMTGTINQDGTIGQVGGVPEKAQAAGKYGAKTFLVPVGQATYSEETCHESQQGPILYRSCQSEQKPLSNYTEQKFGMKVIEVNNIMEALQYFQGNN